MLANEINWCDELRAADNSAAVGELRLILLNGLRTAMKTRTDVSTAHLEDFVQDALVRILARLDEFEGRSKFTTWAHSIALNVAFTELRRKRWRDVSLDGFIEEGKHFAEAVVAPQLPESHAEREQVVATLQRAIADDLSDKQRAIIAGMLSGTPFDQIVELLRTNRNAAYKLVHDARRTLKTALTARGISLETIRAAFSV